MVSVIIPSRSAQYLRQTVNDLLTKAEGEVEVIVVYDGRWPEPDEIPANDPRLIQIHHGVIDDNPGMRASINSGVLASKGDYLLVIDEQCMVDQSYDVKLAADCEDNWVVIPRRKRLDAENWTLIDDGRPDIDYMQVDYPYQRPYDKTCGLHGAEWRRPERADILIDDTPTMQGSCYFMKRTWWDKVVGPLDDVNYGTFTQEAQEVSFKTWFSGGRVVVNKKTWYAHLHKGRRGKGYGFSNDQYKRHLEGTERGRVFAINYWMNTKDYAHDFKWYINEKFPNSPGWENWEQRVKQDAPKDFSTTYEKEGYKPTW
jgi:glycosyltransferase involved in cell wall biosynthesis